MDCCLYKRQSYQNAKTDSNRNFKNYHSGTSANKKINPFSYYKTNKIDNRRFYKAFIEKRILFIDHTKISIKFVGRDSIPTLIANKIRYYRYAEKNIVSQVDPPFFLYLISLFHIFIQYFQIKVFGGFMPFTAIFEKVPEGYIGYVEELPGANTQGVTLEETRENLKEAIQLVLEANRILAEDAIAGKEVIKETIEVMT
jgi:predicted RNase H-like HicB family nuclease